MNRLVASNKMLTWPKMWRNTFLCLSDGWYLGACLIYLQYLSRIRCMASEGKLSVYQVTVLIGRVTGNKRECIYSPLQLKVRSRSELQKSLSLGNESNTWNTQQKPPPKEKRDGMKRKLPALCSGTHDISISWLMPVAFEHTQTEVKRFFSWLRILFYMKNKVIKYIKFCCCSCQEPLSMLCNFGS